MPRIFDMTSMISNLALLVSTWLYPQPQRFCWDDRYRLTINRKTATANSADLFTSAVQPANNSFDESLSTITKLNQVCFITFQVQFHIDTLSERVFAFLLKLLRLQDGATHPPQTRRKWQRAGFEPATVRTEAGHVTATYTTPNACNSYFFWILLTFAGQLIDTHFSVAFFRCRNGITTWNTYYYYSSTQYYARVANNTQYWHFSISRYRATIHALPTKNYEPRSLLDDAMSCWRRTPRPSRKNVGGRRSSVIPAPVKCSTTTTTAHCAPEKVCNCQENSSKQRDESSSSVCSASLDGSQRNYYQRILRKISTSKR